MFTYFKMKRNELKVKSALYETAALMIDNQMEYIGFIQRLYTALKDVPVDELKSEFISKIAELAYEKSQDINDENDNE